MCHVRGSDGSPPVFSYLYVCIDVYASIQYVFMCIYIYIELELEIKIEIEIKIKIEIDLDTWVNWNHIWPCFTNLQILPVVGRISLLNSCMKRGTQDSAVISQGWAYKGPLSKMTMLMQNAQSCRTSIADVLQMHPESMNQCRDAYFSTANPLGVSRWLQAFHPAWRCFEFHMFFVSWRCGNL